MKPLEAAVSDYTPSELVGHFRVERTAGFLPPLHFAKRIDANGRGVTSILGLPLFPFYLDVTGATPPACVLRYVALPVRDELVLTPDGWNGRGLIFGLEFCRFRLV